MSKKLISFLGVGNYVEVNYYSGDTKNLVKNCKFIQEALIKIFCKDWDKKDSIKILLTKEAETKNWKSSGNHKGLEDIIKDLKLKCRVEPVFIPEGKNQEELWKIFDIILKNIDDKDRIIFDITHSFRSIPLLVIIILNYAKFLKNIEVEGIYYGAVETLGPLSHIKELPSEQKNAPIFDLTPFVSLFDWTIGIERFKDTGDASFIFSLTKKTLSPYFQQMGKKKINEDIVKINKFAKSLKTFTDNISTSRALYISKSTEKIFKNLKEAKQLDLFKFIPPVEPLLTKVEEKFKNFSNKDNIQSQFEAVKWALNHNFIQQGFTILREVLISLICKKSGIENFEVEENRRMVTDILNQRNNFEKNDKREKVERYLSQNKELINIWEQVIQYRNDINHAGYLQNSHTPENFKGKLEEFVDKLEKYFE